MIYWNHGSVSNIIYRPGQLEINSNYVSNLFISVTRLTHGRKEGLIVAYSFIMG